MATNSVLDGDALAVVPVLIETGDVDTVYRDIYLDRARTLLGAVLSPEEFERVEQLRGQLATLPLQVGRAVEHGNWPLVKELTGRIQALRQTTQQKGPAMAVARDVYAVTDVKLDPFSPGLQQFVQGSASGLAALRSRALEHLATLGRTDAAWRGFYEGRRAAFEKLAVTGTTAAASESTARRDPRVVAAEALKSGDVAALGKLADNMIAAAQPRTQESTRPAAASSSATPSTDLLTAHSAETLEGARRLGLAPRRLAERTEFASLREYAWNPFVSDRPEQINVHRVPLPAGTPEAFRERLEMLMIHPLVNSGGARHLPTLVAEDVLIEDFPDFGEGERPPASELLALLGLPARCGLSRIAIEQALLARGARVLADALHVDPAAFRLVCIPPDVHLRLGETEGWGRQPLWTHFDGYLVLADGRKRALAGGHAKFGGLYNLMGLSRDYDSERVLVRFAVVRRDRMGVW